MEIIWMLVIGLVIGILAKLIMPGEDPGGVLLTIVIGVAGAVLAGLIGRSAGWYAPGQPAGFIASVVGAVLVLAVYRLAVRRRGRDIGP